MDHRIGLCARYRNNSLRWWSWSEFRARPTARKVVPVDFSTSHTLLSFRYKWSFTEQHPCHQRLSNATVISPFCSLRAMPRFPSHSKPCTCSSLSFLPPRFPLYLAPPPLVFVTFPLTPILFPRFLPRSRVNLEPESTASVNVLRSS